MNHTMSLFAEAFEKITSGMKTIEIRCNDEKRQAVKVGDTITFVKLPNKSETLTAIVTALYPYKTFFELYSAFDFTEFGCKGLTMDEMLTSTRETYSEEKESNYGALGIRIELGLDTSIKIMKNRIADILCINKPSIYIYGSIVLDDFKLGWSDIDILCLTQTPMTCEQSNKLVNLRQELSDEYKDNKYFRSFEGEISLLDAFRTKSQDSVVYWGSSGQRINEISYFDVFGTIELLDSGMLLCGEDIRDKIKYPTSDEIRAKVIHHYDAIRKYAQETGRSIYSAGWLLDIARCLYTLRTGKIIAKTKAGEWVLENNLAPDEDVLKKAVDIRKEPLKYKDDESVLDWSETLGKYIQHFADVLEGELTK